MIGSNQFSSFSPSNIREAQYSVLGMLGLICSGLRIRVYILCFMPLLNIESDVLTASSENLQTAIC